MLFRSFCSLLHGELVEVLGMDDNGINMIVFFGWDGLLMAYGVLPKNLQRIDHISQRMPILFFDCGFRCNH